MSSMIADRVVMSLSRGSVQLARAAICHVGDLLGRGASLVTNSPHFRAHQHRTSCLAVGGGHLLSYYLGTY
jgi:hypothetical protein